VNAETIMTPAIWEKLGEDLHQRVEDIRGMDSEWGEYTYGGLLNWLTANGFYRLRRSIEQRTAEVLR